MSILMSGGFFLLASDAPYGNFSENSPQQFTSDHCSSLTRLRLTCDNENV